MTSYRTHCQVAQLARTLGVPAEQLASFDRLGAEYLHELNASVSAQLFDAQAPMFRRISSLAPLVPNQLVARLAPSIVDPLVAGRAAGTLGIDHTSRIEDLLGRLPAAYMADCAPHLDPRTLAVLASAVRGGALIPGARELLARGDYVTAAGFVEFATEQLITDFEQGLDDDLGLLRTAAVAYSDSVLQMIVAAIPDERMTRIIAASLCDVPSVLAGLSVIARLATDERERLQSMLAKSLDEASRRTLLTALESDADDDEMHAVAQAVLADVSQ
jgi:hypothetical protein